MKCQVCNLEYECNVIYESKFPLSIASDNKLVEHGIQLHCCKKCGHIFKIPSAKILDEVYKAYRTDVILPDQEALKFLDSNDMLPLSDIILNNISCYLPLDFCGNIMDFGTGSGGMLRAFSLKYKNADLFAFDVSNRLEENFYNIKNFRKFYTNIDIMQEKFTCISAIHCIEHILDLRSTLEILLPKISDGGYMLVQVPNLLENIWDIFIADHCHHFTKGSLERLFRSFGYKVVFPEKQVDRQITALIKKESSLCLHHDNVCDSLFESQNGFSVDRLMELLYGIRTIKDNGRKVAVFGTTTISSAVASMLESSCEYFLDEDKRKIGKMHLGREIIHPDSCRLDVLLPFGSQLGRKIRSRFSEKLNIIDVF